MTFRTIGRELLGYVIRISSLCKIIIVTTVARVRGIVVVTIMAGSTVVGNSRMRSEQLVIVIVYRERGRHPSRIGSVAGFAGSRYIQRDVVRIDTLVIISLMASRTCIGCIVVIALVTIITRGGQVCPGQWPVAVAEGRWYPGTLSVTLLAVQRELLRFVIRVGCIVVIVRVTPRTCVRCVVVVTVMTRCTVVGNGCVRSDQLVEVVVYRECGRCPSRIGSVAGFTSRWQVKRRVIRVDTLVVVGSMASCTGVGGTAVVTLVTVVAGYTCVRTGKRPEAVVKS